MSCTPVLPVSRPNAAAADCRTASLPPASRAAEDAMTVLLVDGRTKFSAMLAGELRASGCRVVRAGSMAEVRRELEDRPVDVLVLCVDRTDEPSWLRAHDYRRMHRDVSVWVYTSWPSSVDATLANFVPADELIYYDGSASDLTREAMIRVAEYAPRASAAPGIENEAEFPAAVA